MIPINKWEKEVQKSLLDSEEATLAELQKQYDRALRDIGQKVKAFQVDIDMLDAALQSDNLDDAARQKLLSQKRSKVYQKQYQEALQAQVEAILNNLQSQNYSTIEGYLKETYEDAYVGNEYILAQQGIPVITPIDQAAAVKAVLTDSKISKGLYTALGVDVAGLKKAISAEVTRGIASSLPYADIARNLNNVSKAGYSNAKRIVVTEGHRIQQTAWHDSAVNAKEHGADLVRKWDAVLDGKTRPTHRQLDGQIREVDEPFEVGGRAAMFPGGFGHAALDINCRCIARSIPRILVDDSFTKMDNFTKEVRTFESPKDYEDFKKKYWSKENIAYMKHVDTLEKKYETKDIAKLSALMTDTEYERFKKLENASPLWKSAAKPIEKTGKSGILKMNLQLFAEKDIPKQESASLKKGIAKYQKRIAEHQKKIANPQDYVPDWDSKDEREQNGLKRHWQKEIKNFQQSIDDRTDELRKRGET